MTRAVIVVYPDGPSEHKQLRMLFAHCDRRRFDVRSMVHGGIDEAAAIVVAGLADVIVAPYPRRDLGDLGFYSQHRAVNDSKIGGLPPAPVEYCRPTGLRPVGGLDDQALYRELLRRGIPADEVQRLLGRPAKDRPERRAR